MHRRKWSPQVAEAWYRATGGQCYWCTRYLGPVAPRGRSWHLDHFYCLRDGGADEPWQLVAACQSCNLGKGTLDPFVWAEKLGVPLRCRRLDTQGLMCPVRGQGPDCGSHGPLVFWTPPLQSAAHRGIGHRAAWPCDRRSVLRVISPCMKCPILRPLRRCLGQSVWHWSQRLWSVVKRGVCRRRHRR